MSYSFREVLLALIYAAQTLYTVIIAVLCSAALHAVAPITSFYVKLYLIQFNFFIVCVCHFTHIMFTST
jgi:hypothetical protein